MFVALLQRDFVRMGPLPDEPCRPVALRSKTVQCPCWVASPLAPISTSRLLGWWARAQAALPSAACAVHDAAMCPADAQDLRRPRAEVGEGQRSDGGRVVRLAAALNPCLLAHRA